VGRNLTDEDVDAIVENGIRRFKELVGTGVLGLMWKGIIVIIVILAGYGLWHK
jgi:hypothetical protein